MKPWVKLYTEIIDDPKIGRLSLADRGVWMMLLALAGQIDDLDDDGKQTGRLSTLEEVAWHIRCPLDDLAPTVERFKAAGMVHDDDGVLVLTHFTERQDALTGAERARNYRHARQKREYYELETAPQQVRNEPVTNRYVEREKKRVDTEREKSESVAASAAPPPATPNPKKREPKPEPPPAVKIVHDLTAKWPAAAWYAQIDHAVGHDPPNLTRWSNTVNAWLGLGWNKTNVKGMLEFFERNEIPGTNGRRTHDQRRNKNHGLAGLRGSNSEYRVLSKEEWEAAKQAQRDGIDLGDGPALPDLRLPQERVAEK